MEWWQYPQGRGFAWSPAHPYNHSGVDMQLPWDTLVHAGVSGRVLFASCKPWGLQVDIATTFNGQPVVLSVLHLHIGYVQAGQSVTPSTQLGRSGGTEQGPCTTEMPKYSDGPHMHVELTLGSVGPYHGKSPYKATATNHPIDPVQFINQLNGGSGIIESSAQSSTGLAEANPVDITGLPVLAAVFALPAATMQTVDSIPGADGLLYRLHEAETFPGFKRPSDILGAQAGFDIGKIAYVIAGNVVGNANAVAVRTLYAGLGLLLFLGLMIAFASAQAEHVEEVVQQVAPELLETAAL